ncbi:hypothetical protein K1X76_02395 [bacterium]|nr:hypothetical protein [bacterium]
MKQILAFIITCSLILSPYLAMATDPVLLDSNLEVTVYSYKKEAGFTAVEIGFTNTSDKYVPLNAQEIYLNDEGKYSLALLKKDDVQSLSEKHGNFSAAPLILGTVLGISGIAVGSSNSDVSRGLLIAALGMGGVFVISKTLEASAKNNKLITFEGNSLNTVDKIPPGMTLGGFLYFPKAKKPVSISIIKKHGSEKVDIGLGKVAKARHYPKGA